MVGNAKQRETALLSTWMFHHKHFPHGSIHKLKACLCVHGDKQAQGVDSLSHILQSCIGQQFALF